MQQLWPSRPTSGVAADRLAGIPSGELWVPPAYYQTSGDTAVDLSKTFNWIAVRFTPEIDIKITSVSLFAENLAAVESPIWVHIYSHDATNDQPDSSLQRLGDITSSAGWQRLAVASGSQYQCRAGLTYWLLFKGSAATSYDVTVRRWHTGVGSMFPDGTKCLSSTDSGSNWSQVQQDSKDAMLNMIINGTSDHVPQLWYGRKYSEYVYIPDSDFMSIPEEGISLDCGALTADTVYSVYLYDSSGTLTLEASTTERTRNDGLAVKTGDTTRRFLGKIYPKETQTGKQGPVDVLDRRLVIWPGRVIAIGKHNPYSAFTVQTPAVANTWYKWNDGDDYRCELLSIGPGKMCLEGGLGGNGGNCNTAFSLDSDSTPPDQEYEHCGRATTTETEARTAINVQLLEGFHYVVPMFILGSTANHVTFRNNMSGNAGDWQLAATFGSLCC